jgi:hypothetical protein
MNSTTTESHTTPIEALFEKVENYSTTTVELLKLNAIDKFTDVVSSLASQLVMCVIGVLFTFLINIGAALWLGEVLGRPYYGFFAIAGLYALVFTLVYFFGSQWIKLPVSNAIITQMLKQKTAHNSAHDSAHGIEK